jgi:hypothetical protein
MSRNVLRLLIEDGFVKVWAAASTARGEVASFRLALDTGTPNIILGPHVTSQLAYPPAGTAHFLTLTGEESGPTYRLPLFSALRRQLPNYLVACHDFRPDLGIDGVLGLDFFHKTDLGLGFKSRRLTLED